MTWREFKSKVDSEILEAGKTESIVVEYIDTGAFPIGVDIFVHPFEHADDFTLAVQGC